MSKSRSILNLSTFTASKTHSLHIGLNLSELDKIASLWSIGKIQLNDSALKLLEQLLTEYAEELLEPGQKVDFGSFRFSKSKDGSLSLNQARPDPIGTLSSPKSSDPFLH